MFNRVLTTTARPGERVYDLSTVRHLRRHLARRGLVKDATRPGHGVEIVGT